MTYIPTPLKREIVIDSIITIHYFEYMRDFVFQGESHDFWEFLYVDKGTILVTAGETEYKLNTGDIIFHKPNKISRISSGFRCEAITRSISRAPYSGRNPRCNNQLRASGLSSISI